MEEASSLAANLSAQFKALPVPSALAYYAGLLVASSLLTPPPSSTARDPQKSQQHPTSATAPSEPTSPSGSSPRTQPTSPATTPDATVTFQLHLAAVRESLRTKCSLALLELNPLAIDECLKELLSKEKCMRALADAQLVYATRTQDALEEADPSEEDEEESLNMYAYGYDEVSEEDAHSIDCSSPVLPIVPPTPSLSTEPLRPTRLFAPFLVPFVPSTLSSPGDHLDVRKGGASRVDAPGKHVVPELVAAEGSSSSRSSTSEDFVEDMGDKAGEEEKEGDAVKEEEREEEARLEEAEEAEVRRGKRKRKGVKVEDAVEREVEDAGAGGRNAKRRARR